MPISFAILAQPVWCLLRSECPARTLVERLKTFMGMRTSETFCIGSTIGL